MTGANQVPRPTAPQTNPVRSNWFRAGTLVCALVMAWLAFRPSTGVDVGLPWDKANHALSFLVLTVLAGCGWPRLTLVRTGLIMLAAGIVIELVQGLPAIGRDADVWDVVADVVGFGLGWAVLAGGGLRRRLGL